MLPLRILKIAFVLGGGVGRLKHIRKTLPLLLRSCLFILGIMSGKKSFSKRLESLGPSLIKLGQTLSTRPDILGKELAEDLTTLQDQLPPFEENIAHRIVREELGDEKRLFDRWEPCLSAASIAQVHRVRLTGEKQWMALKILRPGIRKKIARDLSDMKRLASFAERYFPQTNRLRLKDVIRTLENNLAIEMDLRMEASAIEEMTQCMKKHEHQFKLPRVNWSHTTGNILMTSWIKGIPLTDLKAVDAAEHSRSLLAKNLLNIFFTQVLEEGFFHADLHPGNLFVCEDGNLAAVDWGITGRLDKNNLMAMGGLLAALVSRDYHKAASIHFHASYIPAETDKAVFAQALRSITEPILDQPVERISMGTLLLRLFEVSGQFNMRLQPQLLLFQRTLVVVEGVARNLDATLNFWDVCKPLFLAWQKKQSPIGCNMLGLSPLIEEGKKLFNTLIESPQKPLVSWQRPQRKRNLFFSILLFSSGIIFAYCWKYISSLFML